MKSSVPQPLKACWPWWAARAVMTHQRILDRPAATLQRLTSTLYSQARHCSQVVSVRLPWPRSALARAGPLATSCSTKF